MFSVCSSPFAFLRHRLHIFFCGSCSRALPISLFPAAFKFGCKAVGKREGVYLFRVNTNEEPRQGVEVTRVSAVTQAGGETTCASADCLLRDPTLNSLFLECSGRLARPSWKPDPTFTDGSPYEI